MSRTKKLVAVKAAASSLFLGLIGCGKIESPSDKSDIKVTNGLSAANEYPSVVMLQFQVEGGSAICTGTFVNDAQVVTAAHCVHELLSSGAEASAVSIVKSNKDGSKTRVAATHMEHNPDYAVVEGSLDNHDVAVVTFPRNTAPGVTPLYAGQPTKGQTFTIVGFGLNNYAYGSHGEQTGNGSGVKRKGQNQIEEVAEGMIRFYGVPSASDRSVPLGQESASGSGDSGGPLLINGALAATTAGGGLAQGKDASGRLVTVKVSNYIDLHEPSNQEFLRSALRSTPGW